MKRRKLKIIVQGSGKLPAIIVFLIMMVVSYVTIRNYAKLYDDKQYADMITCSENLGTQVYGSMMKSFSQVIAIAEMTSSRGLEVAKSENQLKGIMADTDIRGIIFAPNGTVEVVFPEETVGMYKGLDLASSFPESIPNIDIGAIENPMILGPCTIPATKNQAMAAIYPYYKNGPRGREYCGVVGVIVDYPKIFKNIRTPDSTNNKILWRLWRYNEFTSKVQVLLECKEGFPETIKRNQTTFTKLYFTDDFYYSLVPKYDFYETKDFYYIVIGMLVLSLLATVATFYILHGIKHSNELKLLRVQSKLVKIQEHTIISLSSLVENRDNDTGEHIRRTSDYVYLIAKEAQIAGIYSDILTDEYIEMLKSAAPMHDIGKIVVPDAILKKPGKLTSEEFEQIKQHTIEGGKIIKDIIGPVQSPEFVKITMEIAESHHEKWNGKGYPYGMKGEEIPLSARIMAIADVFDALTAPRCYKEPFSFEKSVSIMEEERGNQFDPELIDLFLSKKDKFKELVEKYFG